MTILQDFILMLHFRELPNCMLILLLVMLLLMVLTELNETAIENISFSRVNISNYNVLTDLTFMTNRSMIKKYDEIRKISTGQGDDYTTGCLLDYQYFKSYCQLIAVDLSKQKELDADP